MRPHTNSLGLSLLVAAAAILAGFFSAGADILVMKDGSQLEIDGAWVEKGRMIEFTLPNGTLGSVRASEVDLDASHEATAAAEEAANAPPPPPPPAPEPVQVITDKDIPRAPRDVVDASRDGVTARALRVTDWSLDQSSNPDVVRTLTGTLRNYGTTPVNSVSLTATILGQDPTGEDDPSLVRQARLESTTLGVGDSTEFEVLIRRNDASVFGGPSVLDSAAVSFDVSFSSEASEEETEEEGGEESEE